MTKQDKAFLAGVMTMEAASIQLQKELIAALRELRALCDEIRPLAGHVPSVKAVRFAGKFMAACEKADMVLAKAGA